MQPIKAFKDKRPMSIGSFLNVQTDDDDTTIVRHHEAEVSQ